jgi:excisionase family DNA binding protein
MQIDKENSTEFRRLTYSVQEVASMLNVNEKTVRRLVDRGLLKKADWIRHIRISHQSIEMLVAGN